MDPVTMGVLAGGSTILSGLLSFGSARKQAKAQKAYQRYKNKMTRLSAGMQQNALTTQTVIKEQELARDRLDVQSAGVQAIGGVEAAQAASGVTGRSARQTALAALRNIAAANANIDTQLFGLKRQEAAERLGIGMQAAVQTDYSYIAKPSFLGTMLQTGLDAASAYQAFTK